jgi:hypothetical protein
MTCSADVMFGVIAKRLIALLRLAASMTWPAVMLRRSSALAAQLTLADDRKELHSCHSTASAPKAVVGP